VFVTIPLADGTRLAATLYLPEGLPAPCLLEALPYRKDDVTYGYRTEYEALAGEHGYAVCRVDVRGTGSSEGVPADDARCVTVEWESPAEGLTIVGHPSLRARVGADAGGVLAVRLCDVAPDGASELVSRGVLRLSGTPEAEVELDVVAHRVVAGHRLRLVLATAEWPNVMASPEAVPVRVDLGASVLLLPLAGEPLGQPAAGPSVSAESRVEVVADGGDIVVTVHVTAAEDGAEVMSRRWSSRIRLNG
jgi:predicted acyl esterase